MTTRPRPLTKAALEELGDARLLLETALHNVQAAVRTPAEPDQAIISAISMLEQALSGLSRVRSQRG